MPQMNVTKVSEYDQRLCRYKGWSEFGNYMRSNMLL